MLECDPPLTLSLPCAAVHFPWRRGHGRQPRFTAGMEHTLTVFLLLEVTQQV